MQTVSPPTVPAIPSAPVDSFILENEEWVNSRKKRVPKWMKGDLEGNVSTCKFPEDYSKFQNMICTEVVEQFLTDDVISFLEEETRKNAIFKNKPDPQITSNEIKCFIGILILSGYNSLHSKKNYLENESDVKNEIVGNNMRCDKFFQIMRFMHCGDNTKVDDSDKMWKLRPFMEKIKQKMFHEFCPIPKFEL